jgi:hypothetical protein
MPDINAQFNAPVGIEGSLTVPFGMTGGTGIRVITFPDGVTTQRADRGQYFLPFNVTQLDSSGLAVRGNRTYFTANTVSKTTTIQTLRFMAENTAVTGNCYFSVWSADVNTGNPDRRLYVSPSTVVGSGFAYTSVTNSAGLVTVPPGEFWIGVSFSSTPTIYASSKNQILNYWGTSDHSSGYRYYFPIVDATGFTAPINITAAGTTFAWVEYTAATYTTPLFQWQPR